MNKLASATFAAVLLSTAAVSYAESPVNSTSTNQVAKEQLSNPAHVIDDCRVSADKQSSGAREHCMTSQQLEMQNSKDQAIMQNTGQDDLVKHQDINTQVKSDTVKTTYDESVMKSAGDRDKISAPASLN